MSDTKRPLETQSPLEAKPPLEFNVALETTPASETNAPPEIKSHIFRRPHFVLRSSSEKFKLEHAERLSQFLSGCQKLAEASPVPCLPLLFVVAKGIVDTLKDARSNVEDALRLTERVCKLVEAIAKQPYHPPPGPEVQDSAKSKPQMEQNIEAFCSTLKEIQISLAEMTVRTWYKGIVCALQDKHNVEDNIKKLDEAVVLFQVNGLKALSEDNTNMMRKLDQMAGSVNQSFHKIEQLCVKALMQPGANPVRPPKVLKWLRPKGIPERQRRPYVYVPSTQVLPML